MKNKVTTYYGGFALNNPHRIGRVAHARKPCSCIMCGNPRKFFKEVTIQERRDRGIGVSRAVAEDEAF